MKRTTGQLTLIVAAICAVIFFAFMAIRPAGAGETPVYDANGHYAGSVHDYGRSGQITGSAGSSIDRAFNFARGR